ncbi:SE1832 family protein [Niallia circulans]|uniref:SE1832 family protein n=1 Tax=Niallia circulans TaxID=1397 RepID=UPI001639D606|nr:SE1832 family protein [Niallia circulans]
MNKKDIEYSILELKNEYLQVQDNLEKLEYVKGNLAPLENRLSEIEKELQSLNQMLNEI